MSDKNIPAPDSSVNKHAKVTILDPAPFDKQHGEFDLRFEHSPGMSTTVQVPRSMLHNLRDQINERLPLTHAEDRLCRWCGGYVNAEGVAYTVPGEINRQAVHLWNVAKNLADSNGGYTVEVDGVLISKIKKPNEKYADGTKIIFHDQEIPYADDKEDFVNLPVGTTATVHFKDLRHPINIIRCEEEGNASMNHTQIIGGKYWDQVLEWEPKMIEINYVPKWS